MRCTRDGFRALLEEAGFRAINVEVRHRYTLEDLGAGVEEVESYRGRGGAVGGPLHELQHLGAAAIDGGDCGALPADYPAVAELLGEVGLSTDGLAEHFGAAWVAHDGAAIVGIAALEVYDDAALLRSVAVRLAYRGLGVGERLVRAALAQAQRQGVASVYLLTTTAGGYFPRLGFHAVEQSEVPATVQGSVEFTAVCPASALAMVHAG